jgi:hypothetical protein
MIEILNWVANHQKILATICIVWGICGVGGGFSWAAWRHYQLGWTWEESFFGRTPVDFPKVFE